jgi:hypothetical protein
MSRRVSRHQFQIADLGRDMSANFGIDGNCVYCGKPRTTAGHDPCIADLPGVVSACCGHGRKLPYIVIGDSIAASTFGVRPGATLYGEQALVQMRRLGGSPPPLEAAGVISSRWSRDESPPNPGEADRTTQQQKTSKERPQ